MHVEWLGQRTPGQLSTLPNVVWENVEGSNRYRRSEPQEGPGTEDSYPFYELGCRFCGGRQWARC